MSQSAESFVWCIKIEKTFVGLVTLTKIAHIQCVIKPHINMYKITIHTITINNPYQ